MSTFETPDAPARIGNLPTLDRPDDWAMSESWQRAQTEEDRGGPINDAERMVWLEGSDEPHRTTWTIQGRSLRAECDCAAHVYRGWCAHLASLWWRWVRGRLEVTHLDTGRTYGEPPAWLRFEESGALDALTPAELDAWLSVRLGDVGVTEWSEHTGRAKGTVGNLLSRAEDKLGGGR